MNPTLADALNEIDRQIDNQEITRTQAPSVLLTLLAGDDGEPGEVSPDLAAAYTAGDPDEWSTPAHQHFVHEVEIAHHYGPNRAARVPLGDAARIHTLAAHHGWLATPASGDTHNLASPAAGEIIVRYKRDGRFRDAYRLHGSRTTAVPLPMELEDVVDRIIHHGPNATAADAGRP